MEVDWILIQYTLVNASYSCMSAEHGVLDYKWLDYTLNKTAIPTLAFPLVWLLFILIHSFLSDITLLAFQLHITLRHTV